MDIITRLVQEIRATTSKTDANFLDTILEENQSSSYIENKTIQDIHDEIYTVVSHALGIDEYIEDTTISRETTVESPRDRNVATILICHRLQNYRYVNTLQQLRIGTYTRCMKLITSSNKHSLNIGGAVMDIKFLEKGMYILIFNTNNRRVYQYKYDDYLWFQKLSKEELIVLNIAKYAGEP